MLVAGPSTSDRATVTAGELVVGGAALAVAVVAESSLLLADARRWQLPAVLVVATLFAAAAAVGLTRFRPAVRWAPRQLAVLGAVGLLAAVLAFPGFPVGMAGWDPGVYTNHALSIARTGAFDVPDPVLAHGRAIPDGTPDDPARFPAMAPSEHDADRSIVGYFHLYPALLAPAAEIAGERGLVNVNPVLGVLSALLLVLIGWRAFGRSLGAVTGTLAGALAATNMIEVWHVRYPTSEALTVVLMLTALLGVVIAAHTGWRGAAAAAGACTALTFLARADGFIVVLLAAVAVLALALAGRFDRRVWWFLAGLALVLVHGFVQAYWLVGQYTALQGVPAAPLLGAAVVLLVGGAIAVSRRDPVPAAERLVDRFRSGRPQRLVGGLAVLLLVVVLAVNYARPLWGGDAPLDPNRLGSEPYYNARAMLRLTWFLTPLGVAAMVAGLAVVGLRRWTFARWLVVLPSLVVLPVYLLNAHVAIRLMWWTRRFVPFALPGMLLLIAAGLAGAILWQGRWRAGVRLGGLAAAAVLLGSWLAMSWPLRSHAEMAGSFAVYQAVAQSAGDRPAAWLWSTGDTPPGVVASASAFSSTLLLRRGDPVERFDPGQGRKALQAFANVFTDQLFVVADGNAPPPELADRLSLVKTIEVRLPIWEITYDRRPERAATMPFRFSVWRVGPLVPAP